MQTEAVEGVAYWLALLVFLQNPGPKAQDQRLPCPPNPHNDLGLPTSIQKMYYRLAHRSIWGGAFP